MDQEMNRETEAFAGEAFLARLQRESRRTEAGGAAPVPGVGRSEG